MTVEIISEPSILELKTRDYEIALAKVRAHLANSSPSADYREVGVVVEKVLMMLVKDKKNPFFFPFQSGTIFYDKYASGFSTLEIFSPKNENSSDTEADIFRFFNCIYAFRLEHVLRTQDVNGIDIEIFSLPKRKEFPALPGSQLEIFRLSTTAGIAVDKQEEIRQSIRSETEMHKAHLGKIHDSIKSWEEKLDSWKEKTTELEKLIKDQHEDLNFVGLSKAFSDLIKKRTAELVTGSRSVKLFGFVSIAFPVCALLLGVKLHSANSFDWSVLNYAIPSITIELLLLYFFRIALRNEYSLKAQLLQLELRYSVCAFVQGYADFAKTARSDNGDKTLEKFEALVFSGITADIQNIPSQFDGVEQLVALIKGVRGKD
ncbi:hypothetical protein [Herbaspirillum rubrisubalbicans]|uniref:hypothetical protein n=1 Tax=Herbaspirillum rubrisubalbicans TaxID=80842 RepID=UPI0015C54852|nr:hypothetical protein [Herbaspirillum rubrisubalbicans]